MNIITFSHNAYFNLSVIFHLHYISRLKKIDSMTLFYSRASMHVHGLWWTGRHNLCRQADDVACWCCRFKKQSMHKRVRVITSFPG